MKLPETMQRGQGVVYTLGLYRGRWVLSEALAGLKVTVSTLINIGCAPDVISREIRQFAFSGPKAYVILEFAKPISVTGYGFTLTHRLQEAPRCWSFSITMKKGVRAGRDWQKVHYVDAGPEKDWNGIKSDGDWAFEDPRAFKAWLLPKQYLEVHAIRLDMHRQSVSGSSNFSFGGLEVFDEIPRESPSSGPKVTEDTLKDSDSKEVCRNGLKFCSEEGEWIAIKDREVVDKVCTSYGDQDVLVIFPYVYYVESLYRVHLATGCAQKLRLSYRGGEWGQADSLPLWASDHQESRYMALGTAVTLGFRTDLSSCLECYFLNDFLPVPNGHVLNCSGKLLNPAALFANKCRLVYVLDEMRLVREYGAELGRVRHPTFIPVCASLHLTDIWAKVRMLDQMKVLKGVAFDRVCIGKEFSRRCCWKEQSLITTLQNLSARIKKGGRLMLFAMDLEAVETASRSKANHYFGRGVRVTVDKDGLGAYKRLIRYTVERLFTTGAPEIGVAVATKDLMELFAANGMEVESVQTMETLAMDIRNPRLAMAAGIADKNYIRTGQGLHLWNVWVLKKLRMRRNLDPKKFVDSTPKLLNGEAKVFSIY